MAELTDRLQAALGLGYRVEQELGGGGMSRVFLAEEVRLGRRVVVKVLPPEMAAGVSVERFEREIQLAAKLQHPHIVPLLSVGSSDDLLYYVMPYIEGESLRAKLAREGELPVAEALRILNDVLDALAYAHAQHVVHRDIKPDNVLLSGKHALVTDFGVAKAVAESTGKHTLTSMGVALGTPAYMAPEQAVADPHVDHRADIYAAGILAYEMLSGRLPFAAASPQAMLAAHVTETPDPVTRHRTAVPEALNQVILKCLEKKPADRWQRVDEVVAQVATVLTPTGGITPTGGTAPTGTQPVISSGTAAAIARAHPVRVAGLFALASVGVLAIVYGAVQLIGLPDWVFYGAIALLALGLPIMLFTGRQERRRALARSSGRITATPAAGLQRHFTWRKAIWGGGLAFAALGLAATVYMAMRLLGIGPAGTLVASGALANRERVLLTDFEATPDTTMGETVTELVRIDLAQSPVLTLLEPTHVSEALERMGLDPQRSLTLELARDMATREGIKAFVAGEVRGIGGGFVVSARVVATGSGEALISARETARDAGELVPAVDRLSGRLRERIGESLRSIRADPPLAQVTTASLEALRLYAQAEKVSNEGDYRRAIALLKEAVARDTNFAMAYRRLGIYQTNRPFRAEMGAAGDSALRRAYALRNRVTERERYHVEAAYWARVENAQERALTSYLALLEKYPDDQAALNNLAVTYGALGRYQDARKTALEAINRGGAFALTYTTTLDVLRNVGDTALADSILIRFAEQFPTSPAILQQRALSAGAKSDWRKAGRLAEEARSTHPETALWAYNLLADLAELHGKLHEADRLREEAIRRNARQLGGSDAEQDFLVALDVLERSMWYAEDRTAFGVRVEQAWRRNLAFTAGRPILTRRYPRFVADLVLAGRTDRAQQLFSEFLAGVGEVTRNVPAFRNGEREGQAQLAAARGRYDEAITTLQAVRRDRYCALCDLPELADVYDRRGQQDSALAHFERYVNSAGDHLASDPRWLARALRRLGELYEQRGNRQQAKEYYHRFVDLWNGADPEMRPVVRDVKQRMAKLAGEKP